MLTMYVRGTSRGRSGRAAAAAIIYRDGVVIRQSVAVLGEGISAHVAECRALLGVLRWLTTPPFPYHSDESIHIFSSSTLIVEQANGGWSYQDEQLQMLCVEAQTLLSTLSIWALASATVALTWIPPEQNAEADRLCQEALAKAEQMDAKVDKMAQKQVCV